MFWLLPRLSLLEWFCWTSASFSALLPIPLKCVANVPLRVVLPIFLNKGVLPLPSFFSAPPALSFAIPITVSWPLLVFSILLPIFSLILAFQLRSLVWPIPFLIRVLLTPACAALLRPSSEPPLQLHGFVWQFLAFSFALPLPLFFWLLLFLFGAVILPV